MRRRSFWRSAKAARLDIETPAMVTSPAVGGNSPTTMRATVDFPEPDSPTSAKVSPLAMSKDTPSTALRYCFSPPSSIRLSQGFETSKTRRRSRTRT